MCKFKSGIILKNHCVVAEESDDSHSNLLKKLGIEDTLANAMTKFIRVELLPPVDGKNANGKWWTDPDTWKINVDQDILPDWYEADPEKYNEEFRKAVKDWWSKHVLVGQEIEELSEGFYLLKDCRVKSLQKRVEVVLNDSTVGKMYGDSMVKEMYGNSTIQKMCGDSTVKEMYDHSAVKEMYSDSVVQRMWNDSTVKEMHGNSIIQEMRNDSTVKEMHGNSIIQEMCGYSTVKEMYGNSIIQEMRNDSTVKEMCGGSTVKEMYDHSAVKEMWNDSTIQEMWGDSTVKEMYGYSTARSFQKDKKIQLFVPRERDFEIVAHKDKK